MKAVWFAILAALVVAFVFYGLAYKHFVLDAVTWAPSAHAHDIYTGWAMPDQRNVKGERYMGCCYGPGHPNQDCEPRPSRWVADHWEVKWRDKWLRVPDAKVETNYPDAWDPGDHQSHACINGGGVIYCFRPGEWLQ